MSGMEGLEARLKAAREWAAAEREETGWLSEACNDELNLATYLYEQRHDELDEHTRQAREAVEQ
ncbi:hypothetical protein [Arthrobacter sp. ISL-69]|uniref:hypothetical protein n=1 Tax=Arthrobacter sp. ISL-69 TaxID=2819113 RepID=UPI001BE8F970|nr:hypothetical protein [Arthrobacter sp. ISL-69]MBT2537214.1 hypothetical protein [Arthrobacter sp. ISL-69]